MQAGFVIRRDPAALVHFRDCGGFERLTQLLQWAAVTLGSKVGSSRASHAHSTSADVGKGSASATGEQARGGKAASDAGGGQSDGNSTAGPSGGAPREAMPDAAERPATPRAHSAASDAEGSAGTGVHNHPAVHEHAALPSSRPDPAPDLAGPFHARDGPGHLPAG